jgi:hypothetical protein
MGTTSARSLAAQHARVAWPTVVGGVTRYIPLRGAGTTCVPTPPPSTSFAGLTNDHVTKGSVVDIQVPATVP